MTPLSLLRRRPVLAGSVALLLALSACGSDGDAATDTTAASETTVAAAVETTAATADTTPDTTPAAGDTTAAPATGATTETTAAAAIDPDRCARNKAAGTLTFLTGFDFAAASSIVEWVVADERGYFDALCLDVELKSSFSSANYPLVAAGKAHFASGGSYTELLRNSPAEDPVQVAYVLGRAPIEVLLVKPEAGASTVAGLKGKKIGVKGDLPRRSRSCSPRRG